MSAFSDLITFQDSFTFNLNGVNHSINSVNDIFKVQDLMLNEEILKRSKRRYKVYERQEAEKKSEGPCPQTGGISAFTFLNFLMGVISIAATVVNNNNK